MVSRLACGPNSSLVEEVIELIESPLLRGGQAPRDFPLRVEHSFSVARSSAWYDGQSSDQLGWTDLREREVEKVAGKLYRGKWDNRHQGRLYAEFERRFVYLSRGGVPSEYSETCDDVLADLFHCALSRCIEGTMNLFFERLLAVYKAGGWPCGWKGIPPDGRLVAFFHRE